MVRLCVALLFLLFSGNSFGQQPFPFYNEQGPYGVGFRTVAQYDMTRTYSPAAQGKADKQGAGKGGRPIQTAIWYPAKKGGSPMRYEDYLQLLGWDDDFERQPAEQAKVLADWIKAVTAGRPPAQIAAERQDVLWAVRGAPSLPEKYPVIIYAPSFSSNVFENAEMMEYLASHGYVVIASPAIGVRSRVQKMDLEHAEAQAADIRFLIDFARSLPNADMERVTAMGFSFGGLANVLAASLDERIKALVCLDGTVRYWNSLVAQASYARPDKLRTPLLYIAQRPASFERNIDRKPDLSGSFIRGMKNADVHLLTMYPMEHAHFASSYIRLDPLTFDEYSLEEVARAYSHTARYVLNFMNGTMKGERAGLEYLRKKPEQDGEPRHSVLHQLFPARL